MISKEEMRKLMATAYNYALSSPDPSSQNGALVVSRLSGGKMEILSKGVNHFYSGIEPEVKDRTAKLRRIEHAERDAIYQAAKRGFCVEGKILVCPWAACADCARAIIGSGISALVHHRDRYNLTDRRWIDDVNEALGWVEDAGIWILEVQGPISGTKPILVSGKRWSPATCEYVG